MNVLEKILEEIEERVNFRERLVKYEKRRGTVTDVCRNKGALEELDIIAEIIRSHMDHSGDDTEMGDWIPCSKRLPEKDIDVLVSCDDGDKVIAWYSCENNTDVWINSSTNIVIQIDVLAWKPLPEPYKPKKTPAAEHIMSRFMKVE